METINIAEKLKGCPKGITLYVPFLGDVRLGSVVEGPYDVWQIFVEYGSEYQKKEAFMFNEDGSYDKYRNSECMLFPSRDQRDWSKFNPVFPPFGAKKVNGEEYFYVSDYVECSQKVDVDSQGDDNRWNSGNYFNTHEQAEYAAKKVKELLLSLRKEVQQ